MTQTTPAAQDTTPVPAQPAVVILKADELIQKDKKGVPELAGATEAMALVYGAYAQFAVPKVPKAKSVKLMAALFDGATPSSLREATMVITSKLTEASKRICARVKASMDFDLDVATLDFSKRTKEEVDQNNKWDADSDEAIAKADTLIEKLGLRDLWAEEQDAQAGSKQTANSSSLKQAIVSKAVESGWLTAQKKKTPKTIEPEPESGWLAPAFFDVENDPEVQRLLAKIDGVLMLVSDNANSPTMREQVLAMLANTKVSVADLEDTCYRIKKPAYGQIAASAKTLEIVRHDGSDIAGQIESINRVKGVIGAVSVHFSN